MPASSAVNANAQRSGDAALAAMRLAVALAAAILFSSFEASGIGEGPLALRWLLLAALCYGAAGLAFWLLIATRRVDAVRLRYLMLAADALFAAAVLAGEGEHGIVIYAPALLAVQSGRDRFGLFFGRMVALAMSLVFFAALKDAPEWSGHPLALATLMTGFWMLVAPGYGRLSKPPALVVAGDQSAKVPRPSVERAFNAPVPQPETVLLRRVRMLVAQGDRTGRILLTKCLERAGYDVTPAADSGAVIAALDAAQGDREYAALILDLDLPGPGGSALARLVRATRPDATGLLIIGLDGSAKAASVVHPDEFGLDECLSRPVHPGKLLERLENLLPQSQPVPLGENAAPQSDEAATEKLAQALDLRALRDLENLGGRDFVRDIANQFVADGAAALRSLAHSMQKGDASLFRDQAHALRSSAANVGARGIYTTCLAWREIESDDLAANGHAYLRDLHEQFEEATRFLLQYLDDPVDAPHAPAEPAQERAA